MDNKRPNAVNPIVGLANGTLINDEIVVYEFDENGEYIGWHKETAKITKPQNTTGDN